MWPFESRRDVLRIGRLGIELWRREAAGLVQLRAATLDDRDALGPSVRELLRSASPARAQLDVVLESAWLPVVLLETGQAVWGREMVEGLLRHRLARVHDEREDPVTNWAVGIDHRPGDRYGLGYCLSPHVRAIVEEGCTAAGRSIATLQPALQWARGRSQVRDGWWVWLELDRALVALVERGTVTVLQPAADVPRDRAHLAGIVRTEQVRAGIESAPESIALAGWEAPFSVNAAAGLTWQGVTAPSAPAAQMKPVESPA